MSMLKLHNVSKTYGTYQAVDGVSLELQKGEIHGIIGSSGAGKSTLLRLMNLLEVPDRGTVEINEQNLTASTMKELRQARKKIGMIFQHFNLVANKTIFENVLVSLQLSNYPKKERNDRVLECLRFVGLEHLQDQYPAQLSGGQKQRVAIARALANRPDVLLCDEPTSALDTNTTAEVLHVLQSINDNFGVTIVIVSHELEVVESVCRRVSVMSEGAIYQTVDIKPKGIPKVHNHPQSFVERLTKVGDSNDS